MAWVTVMSLTGKSSVEFCRLQNIIDARLPTLSCGFELFDNVRVEPKRYLLLGGSDGRTATGAADALGEIGEDFGKGAHFGELFSSQFRRVDCVPIFLGEPKTF